MNGWRIVMRLGAVTVAATVGLAGAPAADAGWGVQHPVGVGSFQDMLVRSDGRTAIVFSASDVSPTGLSVAFVDRAGNVRREAVATGGFGQGSLAESGRELLVAWGAKDGVKVRSRVGSAWTPVVRIASGQRFNVQVVASPSGRAVAVWQGPGRRLSATWRSRTGGAWHAPVILGSGPPLQSAPATVRMDRAGNAIVVWRVGTVRGRVLARVLPARATSWSAPERLSPPAVFTEDARVAVGAGGDVLVAWQTGRALWLSSGRLPALPGPARRFASGLVAPPAVGVGARGDAAVLWTSGRTFVRSRAGRGTFAAAQRTRGVLDTYVTRGGRQFGEIPIDRFGTATFTGFAAGAGCPAGGYASPFCVTAVRRTLAGRWTSPRVVLSIPVGGEVALPFVASGPSGAVSIAGSSAVEMSDVGTPPDSFVHLVSWRP